MKHNSPAALCRATGATRDAAAEDGLDRRIACARATLAHGENFLEVARLHEIALHAAEAMLLGCGRQCLAVRAMTSRASPTRA
jgi:hypothetical protein